MNLTVEAGQFFGFLGPNGAGKSTTIKMLTGLLAPTSGTIHILGADLTENSAELKRQIGVVPEGMALFGRLTASEYLRFVGRMYGLDKATTEQRTEELLDFMNLAGEDKKLVTDFSHGMQKKLALAAAVIHGPKVLFLDEPFEGVDAIAAGTLKSMLQRMIARGATIFLTSHVLEIVERLCTHIGIIHRGRLVAQGSIEQLRAGVASSGQRATDPRADLPRNRRHRPRRQPRRHSAGAGALVAQLDDRAPIPASTQLLAIAWLRWRIFVNSFRRQANSGKVGGLVASILLRMLPLARHGALGRRARRRLRLPRVDGGRRSPSGAAQHVARGHHPSVAVCRHQRNRHRRQRLQLRPLHAAALSPALRPLSRPAPDAWH